MTGDLPFFRSPISKGPVQYRKVQEAGPAEQGCIRQFHNPPVLPVVRPDMVDFNTESLMDSQVYRTMEGAHERE
jgi:hypothetical protein